MIFKIIESLADVGSWSIANCSTSARLIKSDFKTIRYLALENKVTKARLTIDYRPEISSMSALYMAESLAITYNIHDKGLYTYLSEGDIKISINEFLEKISTWMKEKSISMKKRVVSSLK